MPPGSERSLPKIESMGDPASQVDMLSSAGDWVSTYGGGNTSPTKAKGLSTHFLGSLGFDLPWTFLDVKRPSEGSENVRSRRVFRPQPPTRGPAEDSVSPVHTTAVRVCNLPPHYMYCSTNNVRAVVDPVWASFTIMAYSRPNVRRNQYRSGSCGAVNRLQGHQDQS